MSFRIGFGFDIHQLGEGQDFWIGGVHVPHHSGAVGHSDADVLIHAICDAVLGALNMRDIGFHFPDTDPAYKGADSRKLLAAVMEKIAERGYHVVNADTTICLQRPKLSPHIPNMQEVLAPLLGVTTDDISIKATTGEKMGFVGREEGVTAYAVVLLSKA